MVLGSPCSMALRVRVTSVMPWAQAEGVATYRIMAPADRPCQPFPGDPGSGTPSHPLPGLAHLPRPHRLEAFLPGPHLRRQLPARVPTPGAVGPVRLLLEPLPIHHPPLADQLHEQR